MSRRTPPTPIQRSRVPLFRLILAVFGLLISALGYALMRRGVFSYENWYGSAIFAPGLIAVGIFICLLVLLPTRWVERWATVKPSRPSLDEQLHQSHLNHPSRHGHKHPDEAAQTQETAKIAKLN